LLDEEWTRHSKSVSRALCRNRLVVRNKRNGLAVRHEPNGRPENLENGAGEFDPFPGGSDECRHTAKQSSLQGLQLAPAR